ncbi:hypothetical protein B0H13DRAFT_2300239 [Mycena leptocephala]|nr:hypothetical protein B0H13DRAFT_2300239 [Mycena leptocephala]
MPPTLTPTNMTFEEMVPDTANRDHDPRFWCLPPGKSVGVWYNWTLTRAMVSGHSSAGAQWGHHSMEDCIAEWQQHCILGVHPHPADPEHAATSTPRRMEHSVEPGVLELTNFADLSISPAATEDGARSASGDTSVSSTSSVKATTWNAVPEVARYFALWGRGIVYTDRAQAKRAFLDAERRGFKPQILSTTNYDEAQSFSESVYWLSD